MDKFWVDWSSWFPEHHWVLWTSTIIVVSATEKINYTTDSMNNFPPGFFLALGAKLEYNAGKSFFSNLRVTKKCEFSLCLTNSFNSA